MKVLSDEWLFSPGREVFSSEMLPWTVSVVFKKGGKPYDYFLGNHIGINVGDEVEVYVHDKWAHRIKRKTARVVYISQPGETSLYARSVIIGKL